MGQQSLHFKSQNLKKGEKSVNVVFWRIIFEYEVCTYFVQKVRQITMVQHNVSQIPPQLSKTIVISRKIKEIQMCTHWNSKGVDLSICDFDQGKSCRYIGLPPMVGNYIISNICQVTTTCCRSRLRPEGKKGFSFSLFMGARTKKKKKDNLESLL